MARSALLLVALALVLATPATAAPDPKSQLEELQFPACISLSDMAATQMQIAHQVHGLAAILSPKASAPLIALWNKSYGQTQVAEEIGVTVAPDQPRAVVYFVYAGNVCSMFSVDKDSLETVIATLPDLAPASSEPAPAPGKRSGMHGWDNQL